MGMEVDDDMFFADLSKQISLLIMDDDEEFPVRRPSSVPLQSFPYVPQAVMQPPFAYELACRRESKGTGVFIPRSSCPRRKNRSGRSAANNTSSHREQDKSGVAVTRANPSNRMYSNNYFSNSSVLKREA